MRAGRLRHRGVLEEQSSTGDGGGGVATDWTTVRSIWCDIVPISGTQKMESMRLNSTISHEITVRYDSAITERNRITHGGMVYKILAVVPDRINHRMKLIAEEGVAT